MDDIETISAQWDFHPVFWYIKGLTPKIYQFLCMASAAGLLRGAWQWELSLSGEGEDNSKVKKETLVQKSQSNN